MRLIISLNHCVCLLCFLMGVTERRLLNYKHVTSITDLLYNLFNIKQSFLQLEAEVEPFTGEKGEIIML